MALFSVSLIPCQGDSVKHLTGNALGQAYIKTFAKEKGLDVIGDFVASDIGLTNAHFYDNNHARQETLDSLVRSYINARR